MALLPLFRSILKRLKSLTRPVPLASGVLITILAIFIWDYVRHPEWFGTYSQEGDGPNESIDLSGLTPEEQAAVADIDNLSVLFNDLGIAPQGDPTIQANQPGEGEGAQDSLFEDILATPTPTEVEALADNRNPFDRYLNKYRFPGQAQQSAANGALPNATQSGVGIANPGPLPTVSIPGFGLSSQNGANGVPAPGQISALERALQNQGSTASSTEPSTGLSTLENEGQSLENGDNPSATSDPRSGLSALESQGSQAVTIPGVPFPVVPTTPEMSPPPGTTGYTPPASLQVTQPTQGNSPSGLPGNGTVLPTPSSAGIPTIPSGSSTPNLATPQVDVSNGATTPSLPSSSTTVPSTPQVNSSPFSVNRPPGSYIGGGYMGPTFSNPSGPPPQ